jgi:hypothetical protein
MFLHSYGEQLMGGFYGLLQWPDQSEKKQEVAVSSAKPEKSSPFTKRGKPNFVATGHATPWPQDEPLLLQNEFQWLLGELSRLQDEPPWLQSDPPRRLHGSSRGFIVSLYSSRVRLINSRMSIHGPSVSLCGYRAYLCNS